MDNNVIKESKNIIWNTLGTAVNVFTSLFFLVIISRYSKIEDVGIFSFAYSIAAVMLTIGNYGGRIYFITDLKEQYKLKDYLAFKVITCIIMLIISIIFILLNNYSFYKAIVIFLLCFYRTIEAFYDYLYGIMQKKEELHYVGKSLFIKSILGIVAFFIIQLLFDNMIVTILSLIIVNIIFVVLYDLKITLKLEKLVIGFDKTKIVSLFRNCFFIFALSFFSLYIVNIPRYMIDKMLTPDLQSIFGIIIMPATTITLFGQFLIQPVIVKFSKLHKENNNKAIIKIIVILVLLVILATIIFEVFMYILGIPIINFIYGIDISEYKNDLFILLIGAMLNAIYVIFYTILTTMRKNLGQFIIYVCNAVISIVISYIFVKWFGFRGGIYAYVCIMLVQLIGYIILMFLVFRNKRDVNIVI